MQHNIRRGATLIGTITCPSESRAPSFGMEVLAQTEFPSADPEGDNQFVLFDHAENHLHLVYEAHCEALGLTPESRAPKPVEIDEEAAHYAREAERDAEMAAYYLQTEDGVSQTE